jgi:hypothetical protein
VDLAKACALHWCAVRTSVLVLNFFWGLVENVGVCVSSFQLLLPLYAS